MTHPPEVQKTWFQSVLLLFLLKAVMLQGLELQCSVGDNKQSEKSRPTKNQLVQLFHLQFLTVILDLTTLELF